MESRITKSLIDIEFHMYNLYFKQFYVSFTANSYSYCVDTVDSGNVKMKMYI